MKDPGTFLRELEIELPCVVRDRNRARLEGEYRAYVNHEIYFFGDGNAKRRFLKNPRKYCGVLTDPVSLARFIPTESSPADGYHGRIYFFSTEETRATFGSDPETYADPKRQMP